MQAAWRYRIEQAPGDEDWLAAAGEVRQTAPVEFHMEIVRVVTEFLPIWVPGREARRGAGAPPYFTTRRARLIAQRVPTSRFPWLHRAACPDSVAHLHRLLNGFLHRLADESRTFAYRSIEEFACSSIGEPNRHEGEIPDHPPAVCVRWIAVDQNQSLAVLGYVTCLPAGSLKNCKRE